LRKEGTLPANGVALAPEEERQKINIAKMIRKVRRLCFERMSSGKTAAITVVVPLATLFGIAE
jgi:hypothetical protein